MAHQPPPAVIHDIEVSVLSSEEAEHGVAEFWSGGRMIAYTVLEDGDIVLRIEPAPEGGIVLIGVRGLAEALARASRLLADHENANGSP